MKWWSFVLYKEANIGNGTLGTLSFNPVSPSLCAQTWTRSWRTCGTLWQTTAPCCGSAGCARRLSSRKITSANTSRASISTSRIRAPNATKCFVHAAPCACTFTEITKRRRATAMPIMPIKKKHPGGMTAQSFTLFFTPSCLPVHPPLCFRTPRLHQRANDEGILHGRCPVLVLR
jgi:hypothetical protein